MARRVLFEDELQPDSRVFDLTGKVAEVGLDLDRMLLRAFIAYSDMSPSLTTGPASSLNKSSTS